ncbi:MAG: hypothetical protein QM723_31990 [Myxococcaceae bacterium]
MKRSLCVAAIAVFLSACPSSESNNDGGGTCPAPTGTGAQHGSDVATDTTWTAADSPHLITTSIKVASAARLTIEPCATVQLAAGAHLEVDGKLVAEGTTAKPITFDAKDSTMPWGYLVAYAPGTISLANATVKNGGGDDTNSYGAIEARGDQSAPVQEVLKLVNVTVVNSAAYGVSLRAGAGFTADSTGLEIRGSQKAGMRINPRLASNIPTGNYSNNGQGVIVVETEVGGEVRLEDVTFHDRGVPYQIGGDQTVGTFAVGGGSAATKHTLTLEAGVKFAFIKAGAAALTVDTGSTSAAANGVLIAQGTAAKPVVFTSAAAVPAAGDWQGIQFGNKPDAADKLDHVEVHFAGGHSQANGFHCQPNGSVSANEDAAITFYGAPPAGAVSNSLIADSAGSGIDLAYSGASVDLASGNTFMAIGQSCNVTIPKDANGNCTAGGTCQ